MSRASIDRQREATGAGVAKAGIAASVEHHLRAYFDAHGDDMPASGLYDRVLREVEMPLLGLTLRLCKGNQIRAAALLGINRNTLRKKLRELGLIAAPVARRQVRKNILPKRERRVSA